MALKALLNSCIDDMIDRGVRMFITGMALGVDMWCAEIVLEKKKVHRGLRLVAALPCESQSEKWPAEQQRRYRVILSQCDRVVYVERAYTPRCMHERNRWMVDRAGYLLAVYDGQPHGGTAYTIGYAKDNQREIIIIHPDTLLITKPPRHQGEAAKYVRSLFH